MKITYIINGMFNSAGMERVVSNKAQYLTSRGHQITIITANQNNRPYFYDVPHSVTKVDLAFNSFEYDGKPICTKVLTFLRKERKLKKKLKKYFDENPQDVIVTLEDRFVPLLVRVVDKKTVIVAECHFNQYAFAQLGKSVNRNQIQTIVYNLRAWYIRMRYHYKLDAYVLLTKEDYCYRKGNKDNVYVIPNSISYDTSKIATLENHYVIAVGRFTYQKGFDRLLESWKIVHEECPEWELHIYGDGEDKPILFDLCKKMGIEKSVKLYPSTPQIMDKLLESSLFVMSSRFEGLPMVLMEAMSVGLPLVSFNCMTGPKDIIKDGYNGFLVSEGDIKELAQRMISLMKNKKLRKEIGTNAKKEAKKYSHENIANVWEKLFKNLKMKK